MRLNVELREMTSNRELLHLKQLEVEIIKIRCLNLVGLQIISLKLIIKVHKGHIKWLLTNKMDTLDKSMGLLYLYLACPHHHLRHIWIIMGRQLCRDLTLMVNHKDWCSNHKIFLHLIMEWYLRVCMDYLELQVNIQHNNQVSNLYMLPWVFQHSKCSHYMVVSKHGVWHNKTCRCQDILEDPHHQFHQCFNNSSNSNKI